MLFETIELKIISKMHKIFFNINYTISCYCCKETTKGSLQIHSGDKHLGNCTINIVDDKAKIFRTLRKFEDCTF